MPRSHRPWIVTPHRPIEKLDENLWALSSSLPGVTFTRRMSMVRLADRRIVFLDAVPMDEATLAEVRAWGTPALLVVTNGFHRLDVHAFREKLALTLLAPAKSAGRVRRAVRVDGTLEALPADPALRADPLDGVRSGEAVFHVRGRAGAVTLIFSDALMNLQGPLPLWMRLLRYHKGPKVTPVFKLFVAKDRRALRAHLERLAETPGLGRLVFCHGETIESDAALALRRAAATA